jgi:formylglycine-generating enzyme required for sulfatase activity
MSSAEVFARWVGRHRSVAALSMIFTVLLLAGTALAFVQVTHRARLAEAARAEAEEARLEAETSRLDAQRSAQEAEKRAREAQEAYATRDEATRQSEMVREEARKADVLKKSLESELEKERSARGELAKRLAESERILAETAGHLVKLQQQALDASNLPPPPPTDPSDTIENSLGMAFVEIPRLGIYFGTHEVRQRDYEAYAKATPDVDSSWRRGGGAGPDAPVVNVSRDDALAFCEWLSRKEGGRYRLPTKAEWEGALTGDGSVPPRFPWGDTWPPPNRVANVHQTLLRDSFHGVSPVGEFPANALGLYDMGGNAREWLMDSDNANDGRFYLAGGSFLDAHPRFFTSTFAVLAPGNSRHESFGFRIVREKDEATTPASPTPKNP